MKTATPLSRALSLIAAAGVSLALLHSVAALPASAPVGDHGPVMAQSAVKVAGLAQRNVH